MKIIFSVFFVGLMVGLVFIPKLEAASNKLSGRILLQVEQNGEAWYVNPENQKRYFLGRPTDAFQVMRELGLGISETNYNKFKVNNYQTSANLAGKILLRVESKGEAYYINPLDLKMHYLGRPADAFQVMRKLGLGITDVDLGIVEIGKDVETKRDVVPTVALPETNSNSQEKASEAKRETRTYVGSGTYDFSDGDVLIDNVNNKKFVQNGLKDDGYNQWLLFNVYDISTGQSVGEGIQMYLEPDKLYTGYDPIRMIYSFQNSKMPIYYMTFKGKNPNGTYKLSFDFYLNSVLGDTAYGDKKILVVPIYFEDYYNRFDQFSIYRDEYLEPAFAEINAYLKVKQLQYVGKEIMKINFTVADAIKLKNPAQYQPDDKGDNYWTRYNVVNDYTSYNPDDFDVITFLYVSMMSVANTARYNQAMNNVIIPSLTENVSPISKHQLRELITAGTLHEILHVYGMSDNYAFETDKYEGKFYNGTQKLGVVEPEEVSMDSEFGAFQKINDQVASEIGWCDENNDGIIDAKQFYVSPEYY